MPRRSAPALPGGILCLRHHLRRLPPNPSSSLCLPPLLPASGVAGHVQEFVQEGLRVVRREPDNLRGVRAGTVGFSLLHSSTPGARSPLVAVGQSLGAFSTSRVLGPPRSPPPRPTGSHKAPTPLARVPSPSVGNPPPVKASGAGCANYTH